MSDCEEGDFCWETLISPVKRKRKKTLKKDKKCEKHKNHITVKMDKSMQKKKKKKKCKFTDAMEKKKEKKEEKKEKKKKLPVGLDHSFIFTHNCSCVSDPSAKSKPCITESEKPDDQTQDSKNSKRKKKVAWDLSQQGYIRVKRPKFVSSTPKQNNQSEEEAVRNAESFAQVTVTTTSQPQDNDSQCTGDDINSQDLFITQKTFRSSPPEPSSVEMSDKGLFVTTSTPDTQREEASNIHLQQPHFYQQHKKVKGPRSLKTVRTEEEEEKLHLAQQNPKRETLSFQKQMDLNTRFLEERKVSGPVHVKPSVVNLYLDEPVVLNPSMRVTKSKPDTRSPGQRSPSHLQNTAEPSLLLQVLKANMSTQTENFFTAELCSYLSFCQKRKETLSSESWKPLDLSLPQRVRRDLVRCVVSVTEIRGDDEAERSHQKTSPLPGMIKDGAHKDLRRLPSCSSEMKDVEVKKEPSGRSRSSVSSLSKGKMTPSSQSESEAKSANSSEDSEPPCSTGKPDLTQVRAVQTRLNESFFFKTKGEGHSLRPESPLMKLAQGREKKTRKSH